MSNYILHFDGYWLKGQISGIPQKPGIYLIYRCVPNNDKVTLNELIYIGQATNLYQRINAHNEEEFKNRLRFGETLCFSVAEGLLSKSDLDTVENALIFAQQPPSNDELKDHFNYPVPASFRLDGKCLLMKHQNFTIE